MKRSDAQRHPSILPSNWSCNLDEIPLPPSKQTRIEYSPREIGTRDSNGDCKNRSMPGKLSSNWSCNLDETLLPPPKQTSCDPIRSERQLKGLYSSRCSNNNDSHKMRTIETSMSLIRDGDIGFSIVPFVHQSVFKSNVPLQGSNPFAPKQPHLSQRFYAPTLLANPGIPGLRFFRDDKNMEVLERVLLLSHLQTMKNNIQNASVPNSPRQEKKD